MKLPITRAPSNTTDEVADANGTVWDLADINAALARAERTERALRKIAASADTERHDGIPEDGPALEDVEMWMIAREALDDEGGVK